jgi:non-ribosomal peptide synthetase component F
VIGSPIANRQDPQLEEMIGFFVNTLVMRVRLKPKMTFPMLLQEVRRMALEAYRHQDMPFEKLVEELSPERHLNTSPIFQVMFGLHNVPSEPQRFKHLAVNPLREVRRPLVRSDLEVHVLERDDTIRINWLYNAVLFDRWRMEQMARHYVRMLEGMSKLPGNGGAL